MMAHIHTATRSPWRCALLEGPCGILSLASCRSTLAALAEELATAACSMAKLVLFGIHWRPALIWFMVWLSTPVKLLSGLRFRYATNATYVNGLCSREQWLPHAVRPSLSYSLRVRPQMKHVFRE